MCCIHGLVNTLEFRCFQICLCYEKLHNEIVYFKEIFRRSRYPNDFVLKSFLINFILPKKFIKRSRKSSYW